jgi:hypothetical protein
MLKEAEPPRSVGLGVQVYQQGFFLGHGKARSEVDSAGGFANAPFLIEYGYYPCAQASALFTDLYSTKVMSFPPASKQKFAPLSLNRLLFAAETIAKKSRLSKFASEKSRDHQKNFFK